jgi:hypothetical protein
VFQRIIGGADFELRLHPGRHWRQLAHPWPGCRAWPRAPSADILDTRPCRILRDPSWFGKRQHSVLRSSNQARRPYGRTANCQSC